MKSLLYDKKKSSLLLKFIKVTSVHVWLSYSWIFFSRFISLRLTCPECFPVLSIVVINVKPHILISLTCFYLCPPVYHFWQKYWDTMSKILTLNVKLFPHLAVFGLQSEHMHPINQLEVLLFTSLLVRRLLLLLWKSNGASSTVQWLREVMSFLKTEKENKKNFKW